ncbi:hypothetical protein T09_9720 [Trichinella sp. T9]|nr:hypothetical protein T09_9720 [Trichinella sp. T9]
MKFCDKNIWIVNPFQSDVVATGISTKADKEIQNTYPILSTAALKVLLFYYFLLVRNWIFSNE